MNAAVSESIARAAASRSPKGTFTGSGSSARYGSRCFAWPITESAPSVRPWNELSVLTNLRRPVARCASLRAPSTASVPEFTKNERVIRAGEISASASARSSCGSV